MNVFKKISIALSTVAIIAGSSFSAQLLTGGNIPLINNIVGVGVLSLDFSSPGADAIIATFIINNNSPDFIVDWTLTNAGSFQSSNGDAIAMADIKINPTGQGTLGTGATALVDKAVALGVANWTDAQTTATINYGLQMTADWVDPSDKLAGLYTEQIVFKITAVL